jgi:hypothetical protein
MVTCREGKPCRLQGDLYKRRSAYRSISARLACSDGCERLSYLQVSDSLHFLNWIEKTGFTVSQVIDTAQGTVQAFWSFADPDSEGGHRSSMFVEGRFRFR